MWVRNIYLLVKVILKKKKELDSLILIFIFFRYSMFKKN